VESGELCKRITTQTAIIPLAALSTINFPLSTTVCCPFRAKWLVVIWIPTRWVGLAYIALSGRRKNIMKLDHKIIIPLIYYKNFCNISAEYSKTFFNSFRKPYFQPNFFLTKRFTKKPQ
jgi:hypothetical protein